MGNGLLILVLFVVPAVLGLLLAGLWWWLPRRPFWLRLSPMTQEIISSGLLMGLGLCLTVIVGGLLLLGYT